MKQKRTSAVLTLILGLLLLAFFASTHVVATLVDFSAGASGLAGLFQAVGEVLTKTFVPDFSVLDELIGFIIAVGALGIALILALVWAIRLLVFRRNGWNLLSPLFFFMSIMIGVILVSGHQLVEKAFAANAASTVASAYWFVLGVLIVAFGLHLVVVGLATSGRRKDESILAGVDVDEYIEIGETVEEPVVKEERVVEEVEEEPVVEESDDVDDEIVIREEVIDERIPHPVAAEIDLNDAELHGLIRKIAIEEIEKRPAPAPVERVIIKEVVREEPAPAAKPEPRVEAKPEPRVEVKPEPRPEPKPEPKAEPVRRVVVAEKPAVKKPAPVPPPAPKAEVAKVERVPFPERMQIVDEPVKADFNTLKSYLLSYGLNSRVSNSADSFRSGRVLYARLTNSGNSGLKLYLPLEMDDYKDSKIPLKSAHGLKQYEDVPVFIYVRSDLSMKRAKELIDDVMLKHGIARKDDVENIDHVKALV